MVTPRPNAIDSPADPAVCTMLCSRIVASRPPNFESRRNSVIEMTATGIDALTVRPTFSTRYSEEAPKIMPSTAPTTTGSTVSSRIVVAAGMYGSNAGGEYSLGNRCAGWRDVQRDDTCGRFRRSGCHG